MKTIYWCPVVMINNRGVDELKIFEPEPLIKTLNIKTFFGDSGVNRCPAVIDELKNTFVIRSPIDFHLDYDLNGEVISNSNYDMQFTAEYLGPPNAEKIHQVQDPCYFFFCEEDLTLTQLPPYYEENEFTKHCLQLTGTFSISRWARTVAPAFKFKKDSSVYDVKRGDIICYFKFNTSDNIKLQKFNGNKMFQDPLGVPMQCLRYREFKKNPFIPTSLTESYNAFQKSRFNKKMMQYIKENLL